MTRQPNRLPEEARHGFSGAELDRGRPLTFRINGRVLEGFAGDTILSAVLAAGIDTAGQHLGEPLALDGDCGPQVAIDRAHGDALMALPMDRTPVLDGMDLVTLGPRLGPRPQRGFAARLANAILPRSRSLGHRFDEPRALVGPWLAAAATETVETDTIVVGGGIAGMAAALAATEAGERVLLVERRPFLGGDARFFGTVGEEAAPERTIDELTFRVMAASGIDVLTHTEALVLAGTSVRAHRIAPDSWRIDSSIVSLKGKRVVLATGAAERLPVFPGNRMPGVVGAVEAFHRAERYGVWSGRRALFATPHNFGYRLALLAADAGVEVQRVADTRAAPQSRFIDFCKASGITLAAGLVPRAVEQKRGDGLVVGFAVAIEEGGGEAANVETDLLVAAGGWQPRLTLWLIAGGQCGFDGGQQWIAARGDLEAVALAGAAAGWRSSTACLASGNAAVAGLLGRKPVAIEEYEVDAIYESAAAPTPVAPWRAGRSAFLDRGLSLTQRPQVERREPSPLQHARLGTLSLPDVAAFVQLGIIDADDAGVIAEERCLPGGDIADSGWRVTEPPAPAVDLPAYLVGRYGQKPQLGVVAAGDGRRFEVGCFVYPNSDLNGLDAAIGVVIGPASEGAGARIVADRAAFADAGALFVRDSSGAVPVSVVSKL